MSATTFNYKTIERVNSHPTTCTTKQESHSLKSMSTPIIPSVEENRYADIYTTYFLVLTNIPNHIRWFDLLTAVPMFVDATRISLGSDQGDEHGNVYAALLVGSKRDISYRNKRYNHTIQKAVVSKIKYLSYARGYLGKDGADSHYVGYQWTRMAHKIFREGYRIDKLRSMFEVGYELK